MPGEKQNFFRADGQLIKYSIVWQSYLIHIKRLKCVNYMKSLRFMYSFKLKKQICFRANAFSLGIK